MAIFDQFVMCWQQFCNISRDVFKKKKLEYSVGQTGPPHKGLHRIMFDVGFDKNVFKKYVLYKTNHKPMKTIWRTPHFLYPEHSYGASLMCQT